MPSDNNSIENLYYEHLLKDSSERTE